MMTTEQKKSLRDAMMDIIFLMLNTDRWLKKEDVGSLTLFDENMTEYTDASDSKNEHYFSDCKPCEVYIGEDSVVYVHCYDTYRKGYFDIKIEELCFENVSAILKEML